MGCCSSEGLAFQTATPEGEPAHRWRKAPIGLWAARLRASPFERLSPKASLHVAGAKAPIRSLRARELTGLSGPHFSFFRGLRFGKARPPVAHFGLSQSERSKTFRGKNRSIRGGALTFTWRVRLFQKSAHPRTPNLSS